MPTGFCTAKFTPDSARVVARSEFQHLRRLFSHRFQEKPIPPKVERVILNALSEGSEGFGIEFLQRAADRCRDAAETRNQLGENFRRERLVSVALGQLRRIVHFDHERVRAGRHGGETHLRNKLTQTESVRWIDNDREMRFRLQDWNSAEIEGVPGGGLERANSALAQNYVGVALVEDVF